MILLFPLQIFIYSNENDRGLTKEQIISYTALIRMGLVRLVTIHNDFYGLYRMIHSSLGLN